MFVKASDKVKVITGKDKGKEGTVLPASVETNRIVAKGANKIKKCEKPSQANANGGAAEKEDSIRASGVKVIVKEEGSNKQEGEHTW